MTMVANNIHLGQSYLDDGWNLIAELNANSSNAKVRTYIWGLDLSGSMQGAGGVGGLLMVIDHTGSTKRHYAAYDGNGNVMGLADSTTGDWSARYEYGPFGEPIRANGDLAYANPIRWSTKYTDGESGLVYYGYRSYNPSSGRWLNRDPIGEHGGKNVNAFLDNNAIKSIDFLGLTINEVHKVFYTCSKKCGPDYTSSVNAEIAKLRSYPVGLPAFPVPDSIEIGWLMWCERADHEGEDR